MQTKEVTSKTIEKKKFEYTLKIEQNDMSTKKGLAMLK